jgi:hypothetical protein
MGPSFSPADNNLGAGIAWRATATYQCMLWGHMLLRKHILFLFDTCIESKLQKNHNWRHWQFTYRFWSYWETLEYDCTKEMPTFARRFM